MTSDSAPADRPPEAVSGVTRLLVGTSGSPGSLRALRYGESLAQVHQAMLVPVIAWELPGDDRSHRIASSRELGRACWEIAGQQLRDALTAVWGEVPDDPLIQPRVERGPAGRVLVNLACHPGDVLIVGAGRRGALSRLAFSRVGRYYVAHAQCPVMAVPPPALARELGHGRLGRIFWRRSLTPERVLGDRGRPAT
jgi:nucleotide-binding universal stress UspA family protein